MGLHAQWTYHSLYVSKCHQHILVLFGSKVGKA